MHLLAPTENLDAGGINRGRLELLVRYGLRRIFFRDAS
jgi:hypothetical protein